MNIQEKLMGFAKKEALEFILTLDELQIYKEQIDILLVGSTATGLCCEKSDVDICILCEDEILDIISKDNGWNKGKPTELIIDGIQLHYYATSFSEINEKLNDDNDSIHYLYSTGVILYERCDEYNKLKLSLDKLSRNDERDKKIINKLTTRRKALRSVFDHSIDPILRMKMAIEIIELLLVATAAVDKLAYDKRKRIYQTTLKGNLGNKIKKEIDKLVLLISNTSNSKNIKEANEFETLVDRCIELIQNESITE